MEGKHGFDVWREKHTKVIDSILRYAVVNEQQKSVIEDLLWLSWKHSREYKERERK